MLNNFNLNHCLRTSYTLILLSLSTMKRTKSPRIGLSHSCKKRFFRFLFFSKKTKIGKKNRVLLEMLQAGLKLSALVLSVKGYAILE